MRKKISAIGDRIVDGGQINEEEALFLSEIRGGDLIYLFAEANRIRVHYLGNRVYLCSIINAKSGLCPEDCAFCSQSSFHMTDAPIFPLVDEEKVIACAKEAEAGGSSCFGIITSGTGINDEEEFDRICGTVRRIRRETAIYPSCSLGMITRDQALALKKAGVETYHHNLETSRSFFSNICATHDYEDNVETVRVAKEAGFKVCSGGIFGMGETAPQRVELALTLRELEVDSVPINFLNPIQGTPLENADFITPWDCLKTIAIYRFIMPKTRISVCGGRERNLRDLQSWMFMAGASGAMIGNYLTTSGRPPEEDRQMLKDLDLEAEQWGE